MHKNPNPVLALSIRSRRQSMSNVMGSPSGYDLDNHGLRNLNMEYWTLTTPALVERIVSRREGMMAHEGGGGRAHRQPYRACRQ